MQERTAAGRTQWWDILMMVLLVGSVALVFLYEALDADRFANTRRLIELVDLGLVVLFVAEWLWRVRKSRPRSGRYALRESWELLGMVPLLLPVPAGLRALRLLRVVRILRVFRTVGAKLGVWQRIAKDGHLKPIAIAGAAVTLTGATLVWLLERDDNPALAPFSEALWWAIVTVTTVGYGDLTPITTGGRFIAAGLMITGIGTIGLLASTLANALLAQKEEDQGKVHAPMPARAGSIVAELQALSQLHARGSLSDEEFAAAKSKVLQ